MKSIFTLVVIAMMASPSFADTTKKVSKKTTTTENTSDSSNTYSHSSSTSNINWNAGLGLGSAGSTFTFGAMVDGLIPVSSIEQGDILVGGQTGFLYGPATASIWIIPIMAASQFNFKGNGNITPYAGLSMGLSIVHASAPNITTPFGVTVIGGSATSTDFAMVAKGGVYFGEKQAYFAELPLGTMGNAFTIFPTVGMKF